MIRILLSSVCTAFALSCLHPLPLFAQSGSFGAQTRDQEEPLQMIITYRDGKEKRRESHHGIMEPVGFPAGQPVAITLQFLRNRAGDAVVVSPLDGGQVDLPETATISADGTVSFTFQPARIPGLYRLTVAGPQLYELSLYGVDPNQPPPGRGN